MPINYRVYSHKRRPSTICGIEMCQDCPVRVCPPRAHEYGLDLFMLFQVLRERCLHRQSRRREGHVVVLNRGLHEVIDFGE